MGEFPNWSLTWLLVSSVSFRTSFSCSSVLFRGSEADKTSSRADRRVLSWVIITWICMERKMCVYWATSRPQKKISSKCLIMQRITILEHVTIGWVYSEIGMHCVQQSQQPYTVHVQACKTTWGLEHPVIKLTSTPRAVCTEQKKAAVILQLHVLDKLNLKWKASWLWRTFATRNSDKTIKKNVGGTLTYRIMMQFE